jgi:UDP-N-acetylglucosamine acyltransferase
MIHPTAIIDTSVDIGDGVEIGPFVVIEAGVKIGAGCQILGHAWIGANTVLGQGCIVHPFTALGNTPQDFSFDPVACRSSLVIGRNCTFRESVTVHRSSRDGGVTRLGDHVYMMAGSHVGHDCTIGDHVTMANSALLGGHVVVGERAFISGNVSVHQFARIGRLAMIGASSFVTMDIPPFCTVQGVPGQVVCINSVGLTRNGFDQQRRSAVKRMFRILYRQGHSQSQALDLFESIKTEDADCFLEFVRSSKRGIAPARMTRRGRDV